MGSDKEQVEVSYDVSNEFFRLWLDERMNYTCAVFESEEQTLEAAQLNKLSILSDFARVRPDGKVLDIGCGWGACLEYVSTARAAERAVGVTLSSSQAEEVNARELPGVECVEHDFMTWETDEKFDSLISICMLDHLCSPEQARQGKAVDIYRAYFKKCWELSNPGAHFGLQTILRNKVPRNRKDLADVYFCTHVIFPGGLNPRLEDIIQAVNPYWEVVTVKQRRRDYQRTTAEWLARMRGHETTIRDKWGDQVFDDYDRYLSTCVRAFDQFYSSLAQYELKRLD
ncbi:MAG: class I SAM-dependent methyltransferase [Polyangiaceae bacterium]|jgi:cyclopropane-fatty-acyl-phospholipid synthase